jgi:hypothetical protein
MANDEIVKDNQDKPKLIKRKTIITSVLTILFFGAYLAYQVDWSEIWPGSGAPVEEVVEETVTDVEILVTDEVTAAEKMLEKDWVHKVWQAWTDKGHKVRQEHVLLDGSRADLMTDEYAIEVDWASKRHQAVGQALHYSIQSCRKPGIILIVKDPAKDMKYVKSCQAVCLVADIKLWVLHVPQYKLVGMDNIGISLPVIE